MGRMAIEEFVPETNGNAPYRPLVNGQVYVYARGTTTPVNAYPSAGSGTPLTQPLMTDLSGRVKGPALEEVWVDTAKVDLRAINPVTGEIKTIHVEAISVDDVGGGGGGTADASAAVKGITKLSVSPVSPTAPIAVGDNDPRLGDATTAAKGVARVSVAPVSPTIPIAVGDNDPRITPWINVKAPAYGALGNGSADDTSAIQAAINAASAARTVCYVPAGTYKTTAPLFIPDNTHLLMAKNAALKAFASMPHMIINVHNTEDEGNAAAGNQNITLEGGEVDGNANLYVTNGGVRLIGGFPDHTPTAGGLNKNIRILNMHIHHHGVSGLGGQGLKLNNTTQAIVQGCEIHSNNQDGFFMANTNQEIRCVANSIYDNGDDDIGCNATLASTNTSDGATAIPERVVISGNVLGWVNGEASGGSSIALRGGKGIAVTGNVCYSPCFNGIAIANGDQGRRSGSSTNVYALPLEDVVVSGNTIKNNGQYISRTSTPSAATCFGINVQCHVFNSATIQRIVIANNQIRDSRGHAFRIYPLGNGTPNYGADISEITFQGNIVSFTNGQASWTLPDTKGMYVDTSDGGVVNELRVLGNSFRNAPSTGVDISGDGVRRIQIHNNQVTGSGSGTANPGIYCNGSHDVSLIGNRSINGVGTTQTYGIDLNAIVGSLVVIGNDTTMNGAAGNNNAPGIRIQSPTTTTYIRMYGNPGCPDQTDIAIASAGTITIPDGQIYNRITGTTTINFITAGVHGQVANLKFATALTVTDTAASPPAGAAALKLASNFVTTADDVLSLQYDATAGFWMETSRSVN